MAAAPPTKGTQRQRQANHFRDIKDAAVAIANDPTSTEEEIADANETVADMDKNLARLLEKYQVSPV